jgi:hypothetical protein
MENPCRVGFSGSQAVCCHGHNLAREVKVKVKLLRGSTVIPNFPQLSASGLSDDSCNLQSNEPGDCKVPLVERKSQVRGDKIP